MTWSRKPSLRLSVRPRLEKSATEKFLCFRWNTPSASARKRSAKKQFDDERPNQPITRWVASALFIFSRFCEQPSRLFTAFHQFNFSTPQLLNLLTWPQKTKLHPTS